jgi:ABC-2 type transport system permease protein
VEDLSPGEAVDKEKIDVLLVVQPSSLTPTELPSVLDAIKAGIPTAIFEDPAPVRLPAPGTDDPKRAPGGMFGGMGQGPQPKCDIKELWDLLGVHMVKAKQGRRGSSDADVREDPAKGTYEVKVTWEPFTPVVWQHYNPYPKDAEIPDAAVFANPSAPGAKEVFNPAAPAVAGLREVLFMAPGAFEEAKVKSPEAQGLTFTPLVQTGTDTGLQTLREIEPPGLKEVKSQSDIEPSETWMDVLEASQADSDMRLRTKDVYTLAAQITGPLNGEPPDEDDDDSDKKKDKKKADKKDKKPQEVKEGDVNVILVADIDLLESLFFRLRDQPMGAITYQFQNVTFALNVIDVLAGDERFINIRKRSRHHASLQRVEEQVSKAEQNALDAHKKYEEQREKSLAESDAKDRENLQALSAKLVKAQREGKLDSRTLREMEQKRDWQEKQNEDKRRDNLEKHQRQLQSKMLQIQRDLNLERNRIQNTIKLFAVLIPTIPPFLIGLAVWLYCLAREREGVSPTRRR